MTDLYTDAPPSRAELDRLALRPSPESRPLSAADLVLPLGVAAVIRIAIVLAFLGSGALGDEARYLRLGEHWDRFGVYSGTWAPGYPLLLSTIQGLAEDQAANFIRFIQVGLALWTGVYVSRIAAMFGGRRAGIASAWIYALYLPLASYCALLYSEGLFLALFVPAAYQFLLLAREGRGASPWWRPMLGGALLGGAALTREGTVLFLLPVLVWTAWSLRGEPVELSAGRRSLRHWTRRSGPLGFAPAAIVLLSFATVVLPWTMRNAHVYNRLVPVGATAGANAINGWNSPDVNFDLAGMGDTGHGGAAPGELRTRIRGERPELWRGTHEGNLADDVSRHVATGLEFIREHPVFFARTRMIEFSDLVSPLSFIVRQLRLADKVGEPLHSSFARWTFALVAVLSWPLLCLLALRGWATARNAGPLRTFATMTVLCTTSVFMLNGFSRLRIPMLPILMVLAAIGIAGPRMPIPNVRRATASLVAVVLFIAWIPSIAPVGMSLGELW